MPRAAMDYETLPLTFPSTWRRQNTFLTECESFGRTTKTASNPVIASFYKARTGEMKK
jgi:hypothetical protein